MSEDILNQIKKLSDCIRNYDYHYYVLDEPLVPDAEYDRCFKELQALEAQYPQYISADSPTQRIGGNPASGFGPVSHMEQMRSLGNVFSTDELQAFMKRVGDRLEIDEKALLFTCEPKLDGLAVSLIYKKEH